MEGNNDFGREITILKIVYGHLCITKSNTRGLKLIVERNLNNYRKVNNNSYKQQNSRFNLDNNNINC